MLLLEPVYLPFLSLFILWIIWHAARSALTFSLLLTSLPRLKAMILQHKTQTLEWFIPDENPCNSKLWSSLTSCFWIKVAQKTFAELNCILANFMIPLPCVSTSIWLNLSWWLQWKIWQGRQLRPWLFPLRAEPGKDRHNPLPLWTAHQVPAELLPPFPF